MVGGTMRVDILKEGVHSGDASGVVPSSFRIAQQILRRLEDPETGRILPEEFHDEIPRQRRDQAAVAADALGVEVHQKFPFVDGAQPMADDLVECILNRTWRPALSYIGQDGIPQSRSGGNVLRPYTELKLSLRLPPTLAAKPAQDALKRVLTDNPPYGAKVSVRFEDPATGWNAPALAKWLGDALDEASQTYFGKPTVHMGEGGSIPFMGMLGEKFPQAQFVVTGVLGPKSNAHGPNEFLHLPFGKKITCCVTHVLAIHAAL
jgi:acetylornithine deacetylase/succinyl-diaminopimelate desuccinylase-like protein